VPIRRAQRERELIEFRDAVRELGRTARNLQHAGCGEDISGRAETLANMAAEYWFFDGATGEAIRYEYADGMLAESLALEALLKSHPGDHPEGQRVIAEFLQAAIEYRVLRERMRWVKRWIAPTEFWQTFAKCGYQRHTVIGDLTPDFFARWFGRGLLRSRRLIPNPGPRVMIMDIPRDHVDVIERIADECSLELEVTPAWPGLEWLLLCRVGGDDTYNPM